MPSRREFMQRSIAASALAASPLGVRFALAGGDEPHEFFRIVFDHGVAEGAAFGAEAAGRGAPARAVGGDPGSAWMNDIEPRWKHGPAAVAGLTGGASLFCLELLARDYGMSVVYRVQHLPATAGGVRHIISGPAQLLEWERRLTEAGERWGAVAARMALSCPKSIEPDPGIGLLDLAQPFGIAERSLFSWVMAPARRARILGERSEAPGNDDKPKRG